MKSCGLLAVIALSVAFGNNAFANPQIVNPGATCMLETGSSALASVSAPAGDVSFASGQTGTIRLICPAAGLYYGDQNLALVFYDTDGQTDTCQLQAYLLRNNASATEGGGTIAFYDDTTNLGADAPTTTSPFRNLRTKNFSTYAWDFLNNFYWVEVVMTRSSLSGCNVAFEGYYIN